MAANPTHTLRLLVIAAAVGAVALLAAAGVPHPAHAAPPALTFSAGDLGDLRTQADTVRAELDRLDREAQMAVERYDAARVELDQVSARLMETRRQLSAAQTRLDVAQELLGQRATMMYKSDGLGLLDILLSADDLTEVGTQLGYFRLVNRADQTTVRDVQALTDETATLADQLEDERAAALEREVDLREKRADVEDQVARRQALLDGLDSRIKEIVERQARLAAREASRLANVDIDSITGTAAQLAVIHETVRYLGIPYVWGGATPGGGFDCSGLVMYVFAKFGVDVPHGATMQARMGTPVPFSALQPADLVFFGDPSFYHHVGVYMGAGRFIEAPHTGDVVKVSLLAGRGATLACRYPLQLP